MEPTENSLKNVHQEVQSMKETQGNLLRQQEEKAYRIEPLADSSTPSSRSKTKTPRL